MLPLPSLLLLHRCMLLLLVRHRGCPGLLCLHGCSPKLLPLRVSHRWRGHNLPQLLNHLRNKRLAVCNAIKRRHLRPARASSQYWCLSCCRSSSRRPSCRPLHRPRASWLLLLPHLLLLLLLLLCLHLLYRLLRW
jgi:hypothetical protein